VSNEITERLRCEAQCRRGGNRYSYYEKCGRPAKGIRSMIRPDLRTGYEPDRPACGIHLNGSYTVWVGAE
jgi:hypothetical protein